MNDSGKRSTFDIQVLAETSETVTSGLQQRHLPYSGVNGLLYVHVSRVLPDRDIICPSVENGER